jgi:hypothetical protein
LHIEVTQCCVTACAFPQSTFNTVNSVQECWLSASAPTTIPKSSPPLCRQRLATRGQFFANASCP